MNKLSSIFNGASSGGSLIGNLVSAEHKCKPCSNAARLPIKWLQFTHFLTELQHGLMSLQSPMTIPQIVVEGLTINPDILDLDTAEAAFENFTSE